MLPRIETSVHTGDGPSPGEWVVQLRCAPLPSLLRRIALHYWFALYDPEAERWERWEVWQSRNAGGESWGHVHRDLMHRDRGVGGGPAVIEAEWRGAEARSLAQVLRATPEYPLRDRYRAWPGPNSNTYAAWVLRKAGITHEMDWRGIGKGFLCWSPAGCCEKLTASCRSGILRLLRRRSDALERQ